MAKALITVVGRVSKVEIKTLKNEDKVLFFTLACDVSSKNKKGEWVNLTHWYRLSYFTKTPEKLSKIVSVGNLLQVQGEIDQVRNPEGTNYFFKADKINVLVFKKKEKTQEEETGEEEGNDDASLEDDNSQGFNENDIPF